MNTCHWLSKLFRFLVLFPLTASCYLPALNQIKYSPKKTAVLFLVVLIPIVSLGSGLCIFLQLDCSLILFPLLAVFFLIYRRMVCLDLSRSLAVFLGVCAMQTFPAQFAYAFDARLYPTSGSAQLSPEAAFFRLSLACLMPVLAFFVRRHFIWAIDNLDFPKIWYSTVGFSALFLFLNIITIPRSYQTLHAGRMSYLFPLFEVCALTTLCSIYLLFYRCARLITEQARLEERTQLLEMQSHQYRALQEYMQQTARLRHDFRHHLRLLAGLSEKGDLNGIQSYLSKYEDNFVQNASVNFCTNDALNALFGYYHEMASMTGIVTDWKISLPDPLTFSELDLAALFGNLIENAISGCQTLPKEQRYFSLTSEIRYGSSLYVVATNSFDGNVRKRKSEYRSTKHSGKGTGLSSITAIAEKYQGMAQFSNSSSEFYSDVLLKAN